MGPGKMSMNGTLNVGQEKSWKVAHLEDLLGKFEECRWGQVQVGGSKRF